MGGEDIEECGDIIERHTRKPAPDVADDAVVQMAKSLRLVSKDFGKQLNFPFSRYLFLAESSDFPEGCRHFKGAPTPERNWDDQGYDDIYWCDMCRNLEKFVEMDRKIDDQLTQNTRPLERMFSLRKVWDTPLVPKYLHIKPTMSSLLNNEYVLQGRGPKATYLTAVGSVQEFIEKTTSLSQFALQNSGWRYSAVWQYCAILNRLDLTTNATKVESDDLHLAGPETYAHKILDIGQTHLLPNTGWRPRHLSKVRVCCARTQTHGCP